MTKRGGKDKGAVMMIFFHPLAILHEVLLSTLFAPFETQIAKKLSSSEARFLVTGAYKKSVYLGLFSER